MGAVKDTDGTAHAFSSLPFTVGAKTGTAENIEKMAEERHKIDLFTRSIIAITIFLFMGYLEGKGSGDVVDRFLPVLSDLKVTE